MGFNYKCLLTYTDYGIASSRKHNEYILSDV